MKARQFVNVVMQKYGRGSMYSVSRIKPEEQLFYPSIEEAQAAVASAPPNKKLETMSRMPALKLRFENSILNRNRLEFLPFYGGSGGNSEILCIDGEGRTVLCDTDAGSLHFVPCLNGPKGISPISFSISEREPRDTGRADALYLMGRHRRCCDYFNFEALMYSDASSSRNSGRNLEGWHWHRLPPPPVSVDTSIIKCHALIDDNSCDPILVISSTETRGFGTYCFNTISHKWFKVGSWRLPFMGRAEHIPELDDLWFGIADEWPYHFCAMDLSTLDGDKAPLLVYSWEDLSLQDDWVMVDCSMVYLGAGKFCITKILDFGTDKDNLDRTATGAVISGLEVVQHGEPSKLLMVKHKSKFYKFTSNEIQCIL